MKFDINDFYCISCGNKGIMLPRKDAKKKEKFHRKKLYCIYCKQEINHIECKNAEEVKEFKENFNRGEYVNEAEESVSFMRSAWIW